MLDYKKWKHVFKLDPDKEISDDQLEQMCESGTDAMIVGGTEGVTLDNTLDLLARIRRFSVPVVLEISSLEAITPGFDYYFVPTVLNSQKTTWMIDLHHQAIKEYRAFMNWDEIVCEGYCILNGDSSVAKVTDALVDLDDDDVISYAQIASRLFRLPIFYLEYSGMYGDVSLVEKVKAELTDDTVLIYGGGIKHPDQATEMAKAADIIVVGNAIYEDFNTALLTVEAVKS